MQAIVQWVTRLSQLYTFFKSPNYTNITNSFSSLLCSFVLKDIFQVPVYKFEINKSYADVEQNEQIMVKS